MYRNRLKTAKYAFSPPRGAWGVSAYRIFQCLTVAIRPLSIAELAELLVFDFDAAKGGIPKLNSDWQWQDREHVVLSTCSSLIAVVGDVKSPVASVFPFFREGVLDVRSACDVDKRYLAIPYFSSRHTRGAHPSLSWGLTPGSRLQIWRR